MLTAKKLTKVTRINYTSLVNDAKEFNNKKYSWQTDRLY